MSKEQENKAIIGRWFTGFWGNPWNPKIVDELAAPDILLQYSLHAPRRGREDVKNFMVDFREAFPDLEFGGAADLIAACHRHEILHCAQDDRGASPRSDYSIEAAPSSR